MLLKTKNAILTKQKFSSLFFFFNQKQKLKNQIKTQKKIKQKNTLIV